MAKLTKRSVDAIRPDPTGKDVFIWDAGDGALKGFGVRMKASGSASFLIQYRNKEGRTRRLALARVGSITAEEARALARERLSEIAKGADPSAERHAVRQGISVSDLCDLYLKSAAGRIKSSTLAMDRSRITTHVGPLIGKITVQALQPADIERMKAAILSGRTAKPREGRGGSATGGPGVAARTIGMLSTILEYARKDLKLIKENPAQGIKKPVEGRQRRFLNSDEISIFGRTLEASAESETAKAAIRFLLLSGFRRMEALALPRTWLDAKMKCVRLGDSKSGYQIRALGPAAIAILHGQPTGGRWFFPAVKGDGHFVGLPKVLERLCAKAGLEGITLHVLRHSFAATAAELGFTELTIAGLLGHRVPGVTARYAHVPDSALVAAAEKVSSVLELLMGQTDGAA